MSNGNSKIDWNSVGSLFGFGVMFIFTSFVFAYMSLESLRNARAPEPPFPSEVPKDVPVFYGTVKSGEQNYLVQFEQDTQITVEFEGRNSFNGLWSGSNATFLINAPYSKALTTTTHSETWGDLLVSRDTGDRSFTPWLDVNLTFKKDDYHKWISISASLDFVYPASSVLTFENKSDHVERKFQFFVISDEELEMFETYIDWKNAVDNSNIWSYMGFIFFTGTPLVFGVLFIVGGISEIRK